MSINDKFLSDVSLCYRECEEFMWEYSWVHGISFVCWINDNYIITEILVLLFIEVQLTQKLYNFACTRWKENVGHASVLLC